jgi:hypothetical protein
MVPAALRAAAVRVFDSQDKVKGLVGALASNNPFMPARF